MQMNNLKHLPFETLVVVSGLDVVSGLADRKVNAVVGGAVNKTAEKSLRRKIPDGISKIKTRISLTVFNDQKEASKLRVIH